MSVRLSELKKAKSNLDCLDQALPPPSPPSPLLPAPQLAACWFADPQLSGLGDRPPPLHHLPTAGGCYLSPHHHIVSSLLPLWCNLHQLVVCLGLARHHLVQPLVCWCVSPVQENYSDDQTPGCWLDWCRLQD